MKVLIATSGSRGDCQPYIALGLELLSRGHEVAIATEERMRPLVQEFGLQFMMIAGDPTGLLLKPESQAALRDGKFMKIMAESAEFNRKFYEQALKDYHASAKDFGAELVVSAPLCMTQTMSVAQALNIPWVPMVLGPVLATGEFPSWALSLKPLPFKWLNRLTYQFIIWAMFQQEKGPINAWRKSDLGLPPMRYGVMSALTAMGKDVPIVVACSRLFIPGQKTPSDWLPSARVTGFPFVPATRADTVDLALSAFVERSTHAGGAPIYCGFGSMPAPEPRALVDLAIQLSKQVQRPAVLCAGWAGLEAVVGDGEGQVKLPDTVLLVSSAPHDWLFPRCSVLIHHCGVGTVAAAMRSGTPSVPCPVLLDQPWNAARMVALGIAADPVPFHKLTLTALAAAVTTVLADHNMATRAREVAAEVAKEPGVSGAADAVLSTCSVWERVGSRV